VKGNDMTVDSILQNMQQQQQCYTRLLEHMDAQLRAVADNDDEALMQAIKEKNGLIQNLNRLEQQAGAATEALSAGDRDALGQKGEPLRQGIVQALEKLITREEACQDALVKKRAELEVQIVEFKKKKNLFEGYGGPNPKGGGFTGKV